MAKLSLLSHLQLPPPTLPCRRSTGELLGSRPSNRHLEVGRAECAWCRTRLGLSNALAAKARGALEEEDDPFLLCRITCVVPLQ